MREGHRVLLVCARALTAGAVQDMEQEAFVTVYQMLWTSDTLRDFGAWLRGGVRFKSREYFRRQKNRGVVFSDEVRGVVGTLIEEWESARRVGTGGLLEALSPEKGSVGVDALGWVPRLALEDTAVDF